MFMTEREILEFIVEHYRTNPRGIETAENQWPPGRCRYETVSGAKCAIGTVCSKEGLAKIRHLDDGVLEVARTLTPPEKLDSILQERFQGHTLYFWEAMQELHDNNNNWEELDGVEGVVLSDVGEAYVSHWRA